jgi:hypothetical protein
MFRTRVEARRRDKGQNGLRRIQTPPVHESTRAKEGRYAKFFQVGHNAFEFLLAFGQLDRGIHTRT